MVLHGHRISAGWGKPVRPTASSSAAASESIVQSRWDPVPSENTLSRNSDEKIIVQIPEDPVLKETIDAMAFYVALAGEAFEISIRGREKLLGIDPLPFLYEKYSASAIYYRWRTYAFAMGDDVLRWRETPYQIAPNGPWWTPPSCGLRRGNADSTEIEAVTKRVRELEEEERRKFEGLTGAQIERAKNERVDRIHSLNKDNTDQLASILQSIQLSNSSIKEAMGFAFDHADAASEVIDGIKSSLLAPSSAVSKIAKLYLLNDILHNSGSSIKHASNYRSAIQTCLPVVFENLNECYRSINGRMSAKQVEDRVLGLLKVWDEWSIFSPAYLNGLEAAFMKNEADSQKIAERISGHSEDADDAEAVLRQARFEGVAMTSSSGASLSIAEIQAKLMYAEEYSSRKTPVVSEAQSEALDESDSAEIDGEPLYVASSKADKNHVGDPIDEDDVDGKPLDEDEVDGQPLDEDDIDGQPLDEDDIDGEPLPINVDLTSNKEAHVEDDIDGDPMD